MPEKKTRTLSLHKDTLRFLTDEQVTDAAGGIGASYFYVGCASFTVPAATQEGSGCGATAITLTVCRSNCIN